MCGSKKSTEAVDPRTSKSMTPRHSRSSNSKSSSSLEQPTSFTNFPSLNFINTGSSHKNSSKSSASSGTSLSSLKQSLPENPHIFEFSEICAATSNFLSKPFSSSSSSSCWRCLVRGKDVIVVQRKSRRPIQLLELKERLLIICRSHHSSLVKLHGASISGNYIYLVYEYVPGANLADCLRNPRNPSFTVLSTWISRMHIATDLAHGLDYIHHCYGPNSNFIHNHIKSSSIIVSEDSLTAKICHFGTSELCSEVTAPEEKESEITSVKQMKRSNSNKMKLEGTRGYMTPEFQSKGFVSQKSDVYAFGVVVLELVSGEEAVKYKFEEGSSGYRMVSVIETARAAMETGNVGLRRWADRRLKDSYPVEVAAKMVRLGLDCVEEDPNRRPDMGRVAGLVSKLYLESKQWADKFGFPADISVSLAPR